MPHFRRGPRRRDCSTLIQISLGPWKIMLQPAGPIPLTQSFDISNSNHVLTMETRRQAFLHVARAHAGLLRAQPAL